MFESKTPFVSQIGYVTRDLDYTIDRLRRIFDYAPIERRDAAELEIEQAGSAVVNVARVTVGGATIKIIEPVKGVVEIWRDRLPAPGDLMAHHHLTLTINTRRHFQDLLRAHRDGGRDVVLVGRNPGYADFAYVDLVADLGHYLELVLLTAK